MSNTYHTSEKDSSLYETGYEIFLRRSDFRERILEEFSKIAESKIPKKDKFTVMDLGCGNGLMTGRYIDSLKRINPDISLTIVDPARESLESAAKILTKNVTELDLRTEINPSTKFDLILASYVFYHLPASVLNDLAEMMNVQSSLTIMMGTSINPLKSHPKLQSNHGSSNKLDPFLQQLQDSQKFSISRFHVTNTTKIEGLWANGEFSPEGKTYIDFSLNKDFSTLSSEALEALNEIFSSVFEEMNTPVLKSVHEIIWIERIK